MLVKLYTTNKTLEKMLNNFVIYHNIKGDFIPYYATEVDAQNKICIMLYNVTFIKEKSDIITLHFGNISIDILKDSIIEYVIQTI